MVMCVILDVIEEGRNVMLLRLSNLLELTIESERENEMVKCPDQWRIRNNVEEQ